MTTIIIPSGEYDVPDPLATYVTCVTDSLNMAIQALQTYRKLVEIAKSEPTKENRIAAHEYRKRLFELLPDGVDVELF